MDLRCSYSAEHRLAVTGSTGFIGKLLTSSFENSDFYPVLFEDLPAGALVIHLSADVSSNHEALAANVLIDTFVLEQVNKKHRGLVFASTNNVYPRALDCRVEDVLRINDYYSAAKIFGEKVITDLATIPFAIIRIADVFGQGQRHGNFFKALERSLQCRTAIELYGEGLKRRTYIHALELVNFLKWIAVGGFDAVVDKKILNVGYPDSATIREIVEVVSKASGLPVVNKEIPSDSSAFDVRTMKVSFPLGYQPLWTSFRSSLLNYIEQATSIREI